MLNLLPASEKRKQFELYALGLRDFAGVKDAQPLDPFALAEFAKLLVVDFEQIEGLSPESRQHLLGEGADQWSGGACSRPLPNGWKLVILNPAHGQQRNRATLMEEVAHVFLGHQPNRLAIINEPRPEVRDQRSDKTKSGLGKNRTKASGRTLARDYNHDDEEAAYAVGAAALIPYAALRGFVRAGRRADQIARHFRVSRQLVEYRIKVTHLWAEYKGASKAGPEQV
ncbi:MAG TPA: ImmA/IrrE family metallo-endopeptidase [Pyrinomonadaceae bacterium]|nr:ImmA/IrrE family metallo-endopeptidase [Pyrinomonadaceae bacterium]